MSDKNSQVRENQVVDSSKLPEVTKDTAKGSAGPTVLEMQTRIGQLDQSGKDQNTGVQEEALLLPEPIESDRLDSGGVSEAEKSTAPKARRFFEIN